MIQSHGLFEFGQVELNERLAMLSLSSDTSHYWQQKLSYIDCKNLRENTYTQLLEVFESSPKISDVLSHFAMHQAIDEYLELLFSGQLDQGYIDQISAHAIKLSSYGMSLSLYSTVAFEFKRIMVEQYSQSVNDAQAVDILTRRLQLDMMLIIDCLHHKALQDVKRYTSLMEVKDSLTDLYTYSTFVNELDRTIAQCQRSNSNVLLLRVNIKDMSGINERYGFEAGNEVLQSFATSTYNLIRKSDFVARGEDDNFYVVLSDTDNHEAKLICQRITESFESQCDLPVTLCFGGACYSPSKRVSTEQLLCQVDEHLKFAQDRSKITDNHEQSIHFDEKNNVVRLIK